MSRRGLWSAAPVLMALMVAGCGGSSRSQSAAADCPAPLTVQDAQRITRFKDGPGRDPRDVVYEAMLVGAGVSCKIGRRQMDVDLVMRVAVSAGPSVTPGVSSVPYFVRVVDGRGAVVQGHEFNADFRLSPANPRGQSQEEKPTVTLPYSETTDLGGYRIAVGLKPTPEEAPVQPSGDRTMSAYADRLDALVAEAAERCTGCGKCFEVCPTARESGLDAAEATTRVGESVALARGAAPAPSLLKWLNACDGSARCNDACPEGINVRQWVTIAKLRALETLRPREEGAVDAANRFRHMAQAVRLLASMQLPSETLRRILAPAERRTAEVLFYTGCNVLRTPHIVLNVMDVLDALEVDFDVVGGTAHCCGVYQFQEADLPTYERMGHRTFQRFGQSGASKVLTWCPTCTKNFDELEQAAEPASFDLGHVSEFLAANLEALKARFVADQPRRRVVVHEHLGIGATVESIRRLLRAVPNLELVELPQDSGFSYACGGQAAKFKAREQAIHRALAEGAVMAGADTIVTMYHSCHRALAGAEALHPVRVVNFTDVLAEALGRGRHPDYYQLYKRGGAMDEAVAAATKFLESNGVRIDEESSVTSLTADIFNETGLGGPREAFADAFGALARNRSGLR